MARIVGDHETSIALHRCVRFRASSGVEREIGRKFGRWLDVALMQLLLNRRVSPPDGRGEAPEATQARGDEHRHERHQGDRGEGDEHGVRYGELVQEDHPTGQAEEAGRRRADAEHPPRRPLDDRGEEDEAPGEVPGLDDGAEHGEGDERPADRLQRPDLLGAQEQPDEITTAANIAAPPRA